MIKNIEIKEILSEMAFLLSGNNMSEWSSILLRLCSYIDDDPQDAIYRILNFYGGMGSLNDLVLCENGKMLQTENDVFDELRTRLYELSVSR
ncbi:DUF6966 domain-containing protein [Pectobacterium peruviense]|uniref:DUF6966 domain-containing protein n=1 Tax=Pectobacterium peruviense TaxID=2066479 RepID=A0ABX4SDA5_9GAMM|nr:hypothetical protein [Pectobacterium peruviense]KML67181.1 hypothetical protein G033_10685 [Pectobacterium peruviense]PKX81583.1 hypothetical protein A0G02_03315 [Pectobacterium peruviense]PKX88011.1 hypothetical protein A0G03_02025 [Pectobacterium peruviense]